jgi:CubicO group peptidase (beta-lactamase class C family)
MLHFTNSMRPAARVLLLLAAAALLGIPACAQDWPRSTPEQQQMDSAPIQAAQAYLESRFPTCYSLLVPRHGYLVSEKYFSPSAAQANNIKSISKSILSALTGIAIREQFICSVDQPIAEFFPEYFTPLLDPRKWQITLRHLLTMSAGFEWGENGPLTQAWFMSGDWHRFTIESKLVTAPGEVFNYNTALAHLLSGVLTRATGMSTLDYARTRLFEPVGMTCPRWDRDPRGYYFGGSEVYITPRDLARFGHLFLRGGRWEGRPVVPADWVEESTATQIATGRQPVRDYGYMWWTTTLAGRPVFYASGYGGQYIFVVPDLDLVVVNTARSDIPIHMSSEPYNVMSQFLIPAAREDRTRPLAPVRIPAPRPVR